MKRSCVIATQRSQPFRKAGLCAIQAALSFEPLVYRLVLIVLARIRRQPPSRALQAVFDSHGRPILAFTEPLPRVVVHS
jgi:hypothetical protein